MAIPAIDHHAGDRRDQKRRNLRRESHDAKHGRGFQQRISLSDAIDQPTVAVVVSHEPMSETPWPRKKRR